MINHLTTIHGFVRTTKTFPDINWTTFTTLMKKFSLLFDIEDQMVITPEYISLEKLPADPQANSILIYRDLFYIEGPDAPRSLMLRQILFKHSQTAYCIWTTTKINFFIQCFLILTQYSFPGYIFIASNQEWPDWIEAAKFIEENFGIMVREIVYKHLSDNETHPHLHNIIKNMTPKNSNINPEDGEYC
jgi:hypothetical protein